MRWRPFSVEGERAVQLGVLGPGLWSPVLDGRGQPAGPGERDRLDQRRFAAAVLTDEDGDARVEFQRRLPQGADGRQLPEVRRVVDRHVRPDTDPGEEPIDSLVFGGSPDPASVAAAGVLRFAHDTDDSTDPWPLPTEDDVASFREHGFWLSPVHHPRRGARRRRGGMRPVLRRRAGPRAARWAAMSAGWSSADGEVLRKNDYTSLRVDESRRAGALSVDRRDRRPADRGRLDPALARPAALQAGRRARRPANVGWHTDRQYWQCCSSGEMLTAWVGFHDVDPAGGSVGLRRRQQPLGRRPGSTSSPGPRRARAAGCRPGVRR